MRSQFWQHFTKGIFYSIYIRESDIEWVHVWAEYVNRQHRTCLVRNVIYIFVREHRSWSARYFSSFTINVPRISSLCYSVHFHLCSARVTSPWRPTKKGKRLLKLLVCHAAQYHLSADVVFLNMALPEIYTVFYTATYTVLKLIQLGLIFSTMDK